MSEIKRNRTSTNFIFYTGYQVLLYVIPFIVSPFLTRTLREDSLGLFTFSNSIITYFVLLANLGIARYGQREISRAKANQKEVFWSLYLNHLVFSFLALGIYSILLFTIFKDQLNVYGICALYIVSALFDVTWLFYGRENFKLVTAINGIFAIIKMVLVFLLVRSPEHLWIYQTLYYGAFLGSNIVIFTIALKFVGRPKIDFHASLKHTVPLLYFSLVTVAVTLYTVFDKTLIGIFLDKTEVAFYEYAEKIIAIPKMFLLTIGTVLFPKMCSLEAKNDKSKMSQIHIISLFFSIGIGIGAIFGLIALGKPATTLYYGENFAKSGEYIVYMSPIILFVTLGDIFRTQFIIPKKRDTFFLISVSANVVINLILSFALVDLIGVYGVIIGTVVAECVGCVAQMIYCRKYTSFKKIVTYSIVFIIFGFAMFGVISGFDKLLPISGMAKTLTLFGIGIVFYAILFTLFLHFEKTRKWGSLL